LETREGGSWKAREMAISRTEVVRSMKAMKEEGEGRERGRDRPSSRALTKGSTLFSFRDALGLEIDFWPFVLTVLRWQAALHNAASPYQPTPETGLVRLLPGLIAVIGENLDILDLMLPLLESYLLLDGPGIVQVFSLALVHVA
jgi:hypothetical protein